MHLFAWTVTQNTGQWASGLMPKGLFLCSRVLITKHLLHLLSVIDGPEMGVSKCPSHQTWLEGSLWNLSCQADGIPIPEVFCIKDGKVYNAGRMHNITQSHAGVYYCNATNVHGSVTKMVAVTVECKCNL